MIQRRMRKKTKKDAPFSARFKPETVARLHAYADRHGLSASAAAERLLDESLRVQEFPGIAFRWSPAGERQPFILGTGLSVWEIYHMWDDYERDMEKLLKHFPHLRPDQVQAGLAYWKKYRHEEPRGFWGGEPPPGAKVVRVKV